MHWMAKAMAVAGFTVLAVIGTAAPAHAEDPLCDWLGWRHPLCGGGAYDNPLPSGPATIPSLPDNGGQMVPNIDGGLSLPGSPGAI